MLVQSTIKLIIVFKVVTDYFIRQVLNIFMLTRSDYSSLDVLSIKMMHIGSRCVCVCVNCNGAYID